MFLSHSHPKDSLMLELPWGQTRSFLVPAADPYNPRFDTKPRSARHPERKQEVKIERLTLSAEVLVPASAKQENHQSIYTAYWKMVEQQMLEAMIYSGDMQIADSYRSAREIDAKSRAQQRFFKTIMI